MATETANKEVARRTIDLLNRQDLEALAELFVPDVVAHVRSFSWELQNREELQAFFMDLYDAFPDIWWEIEDVLAEGDTVFVRFTTSGTHAGRLATVDVEPTGEPVEVEGMVLYRFEEDRVVEVWLLWDVPGLMQQLGAAPFG